jgi:hypothetical protein
MGPFVITRIVRHEDNVQLFGQLPYVVYAAEEGVEDSPEFAWKYFENMPVTVECYAPEDPDAPNPDPGE